MRLVFHQNKLECYLGDVILEFDASSDVRNELNGRRRLHDPEQVVRAIAQDPYHKPPVMPRSFPRGVWQIYAPRKRTDRYLAPFFIPTDAEQLLEVWELDEEGGYKAVTGEKVLDLGYGLHYSGSSTTVGCIRIHERSKLLWLVNAINVERELGRSILLEVI